MTILRHVSKEYPPNYAKIVEAFPECVEKKAVFCYGDTVYNPFDNLITPDLMEHEEVHAVNQGNYPDKWWDKYIHDKEFRLDEEIQAYSAQYQFIKPKVTNRNLKHFLTRMAESLSSGLYGVDIDIFKAESRIRNYKKVV